MKKKSKKKDLQTSFDIAADYIDEHDRLTTLLETNNVYLDELDRFAIENSLNYYATLGNFWLDINRKLNK